MKNLKIILIILLLIASINTAFVDDKKIFEASPSETYNTSKVNGQQYYIEDDNIWIHEVNTETKAIGEVIPVISNETYKLHGNIIKENSHGQFAYEGYKLKLKGSNKTATVKQLGQYLFEDMPIGHNIIEIYDENDNYLDMFEIIFNEGYLDFVDYGRKIIYVDLYSTKRDSEFKDKFQVSFSLDETGKIHFDEIGTYNDIIGDIKLISLDKTINLYGQILKEGEDADSFPNITIEVENTDISCTTGIYGDYMLPDVPIENQKLIFYDENSEYIASVELLFNIDGGDICLNSLEKMIIDVGNSDGRIFTNMQIGFEINADNRSLRYDKDKIRGNVESPENRTIYATICISFILVFLFIIVFIDRKTTKNQCFLRQNKTNLRL